jgi:hypothetical protein
LAIGEVAANDEPRYPGKVGTSRGLVGQLTGRANLPDFLVLGAARAGTTAIYEALNTHPDIRLTRTKETNFFAYRDRALKTKGPGNEYINNSITSLDEYLKQFPAEKGDALFGEVCPLYLFEPMAPLNIRELIPDARLIAVLRNPIQQAWSHFLYARYNAIEPESDFTRALMLEDERLAAGWQPLFGYSRFPRYGEQIARYLEYFRRDQILILDYADFRKDAARELARMAEFIGARTEFAFAPERNVNASDIPRNEFLQALLMRPNPLTAAARVLPLEWRRRLRDKLANLNRTKRSSLTDDARSILKDRLQDDVNALSDLLGRDYRPWLAEERATS